MFRSVIRCNEVICRSPRASKVAGCGVLTKASAWFCRTNSNAMTALGALCRPAETGPFAVSLLLSENCINADIGAVGRSISDRWLDPLNAVALRLLLNVRQTLYREPPSSERFRCTAANQFVGISYAERLGILRCFELVPSDRYGDWCSAIRK